MSSNISYWPTANKIQVDGYKEIVARKQRWVSMHIFYSYDAQSSDAHKSVMKFCSWNHNHLWLKGQLKPGFLKVRLLTFWIEQSFNTGLASMTLETDWNFSCHLRTVKQHVAESDVGLGARNTVCRLQMRPWWLFILSAEHLLFARIHHSWSKCAGW